MATVSLKAYISDLEQFLEQQRYEEVIAHCRYILQNHPKNVAIYRILGQALVEKSRHDEAIEVFIRLLSAEPGDFKAHVGLSEIYQQPNRAKLDQAIWHLERAIEQQPNQPVLIEQLQELYRLHTGQALDKIQLTRGALARQYISSQMYDQAIQELNAALDEQPDRLDLHVLLMETLWQAKYLREAGEKALEILDALPDCLSANRLMARLWLMAKRPQDAQPFLEKIEELAPYESLELVYKSIDPNGVVPEGRFSLARFQWSADTANIPASVATPDWLDSIGTAFVAPVESKPTPPPPAPVSSTLFPDWVGDTDSSSEEEAVDLPEWFAASGADFSPSAPKTAAADLPSPDDWFSELAGEIEQMQPAAIEEPAPAASIDDLDWFNEPEAEESILSSAAGGPSLSDEGDFLASFLEAPVLLPTEDEAADLDWMLDSASAEAQSTSSTAASFGFTALLSELEARNEQFDQQVQETEQEIAEFGGIEGDITGKSLPEDTLDDLRLAARPPSADEVAELLASARGDTQVESSTFAQDIDRSFDADELLPSWVRASGDQAPIDEFSMALDHEEPAFGASDQEELVPSWINNGASTRTGGVDVPESGAMDDLGLPAPEWTELTPEEAADEFALLFGQEVQSEEGLQAEVAEDWEQTIAPIESEPNEPATMLAADDLNLPEPDFTGTPLEETPAEDEFMTLFKADEISAAQTPLADTADMADWMSDFAPVDTSDIFATDEFGEPQGEAQWLSAPTEVPDWNENVSALTGEQMAAHPEWLGPIHEELDWLVDDKAPQLESLSSPSSLEAEPEGEAGDFGLLFGEEPATEGALDWLSGSVESQAEAEPEGEAEDLGLLFGEEPAAEGMPDWLSGGVELQAEAEPEGKAEDLGLLFGEEPAAEGMPDWLSGGVELQAEAEPGDWLTLDDILPAESEPAPVSAMSSKISDWLAGDEIKAPPTDDDTADFALEELSAESSDWLAGEELSVEPVLEHEVTDLDWLAETPPALEPAYTGATPEVDVLFAEDVMPEVDDDIARWLSSPEGKVETPAWSSSIVEAAPAYQERMAEEESPAWLSDVDLTSAIADTGETLAEPDKLFDVITSGGNTQAVLKEAALTPEFDWMSAFAADAEPSSTAVAETGTNIIDAHVAREEEDEWVLEGAAPSQTIDLSDLFSEDTVPSTPTTKLDVNESVDFDELERDTGTQFDRATVRQVAGTYDFSEPTLAPEPDFTDTMLSDELEAEEKRRTDEFVFKKAPPWMRKLQKPSSGERK